jgi:hypothetical protein
MADKIRIASLDDFARLNATIAARQYPFIVTVADDDRSAEQNAMLHKLLTDISRQVEHAGKKWNVLIWKRLCTAAWMREEGESVQLIPALDGNGFDLIYEHTSKLGVKKCASLIEWILAFGAEHQVKWTAKDNYGGRY